MINSNIKQIQSGIFCSRKPGKGKVPEIRELPPTDSTLSSEEDSKLDEEDDTTLADAATTGTSQSMTMR